MAIFSLPKELTVPYGFGDGMELMIDAQHTQEDDELIVMLLGSGMVQISIIVNNETGFQFYQNSVLVISQSDPNHI